MGIFKNLFKKLKYTFTKTELDDDFYDELEQTLISSDMGIETSEEIIDEFSLDNQKISELADRWNKVEDSFGLFPIFTRGKKTASFRDEIARELNLDEAKAESLLSKLQAIAPQDRMIKKLGNKIDPAVLKDGNDALEKAVKRLIGENNPDLKYFYDNFTEINSDADRGNFARKLIEIFSLFAIALIFSSNSSLILQLYCVLFCAVGL